jgi:hypothetical protein
LLNPQYYSERRRQTPVTATTLCRLIHNAVWWLRAGLAKGQLSSSGLHSLYKLPFFVFSELLLASMNFATYVPRRFSLATDPQFVYPGTANLQASETVCCKVGEVNRMMIFVLEKEK